MPHNERSDDWLGSMSPRTAKKLLTRGNKLCVLAAQALELLAAGREISADDLRSYASDLRGWAADVRAISSEDAP